MEDSALDATNVKEAFYDLFKEMYKEISKKLENIESQAETWKEGIQLDTNDDIEKKVVDNLLIKDKIILKASYTFSSINDNLDLYLFK